MAMKRILPVLVFCLLIGVTVVQAGQASGLDSGPGFITPDSPFYQVEVMVDNVAVSVGVKDAGDVAQERAAEASKMQADGKPGAAQRAATAASGAVKAAGNGNNRTAAGIDRAIDTLNDVRNNASADTRDGLTAAIDNLKQVRKILPNATPQGPSANDTPTRPEPPETSETPYSLQTPESPSSADLPEDDTDTDTDEPVPSYCLPPTPIPDDWTLPDNCTTTSIPKQCLPPDPMPSNWTLPADCTPSSP
jgi:hypothetical protein